MELLQVTPLFHFRSCVDYYDKFEGIRFICEDKNLKAFESKEAFREWFSQPPGPVGNPYRDEGFYVRDLAEISQKYQPNKIVEIGTAIGMGTLILRILNPGAEIITIDNRNWIPTGDGTERPVGFLAELSKAGHTQVLADSSDVICSDVEFYFIDGDHSYEGVAKDSENAWTGIWKNKLLSKWAIAWHDYNDRHPGCVNAVNEFIAHHGLALVRKPDSCTVWTGSLETKPTT